jgi:large subunit ribosomal protein L3
MALSLIAKKIGQTQVYQPDGALVHVTVVEAGPCVVLQKKNVETDGYNAFQLGFGEQKPQRVTKAQLGHFKKAGDRVVRVVRETRDDGKHPDLKVGDLVTVKEFPVNSFVDVIGVTKGKGFEGVMRRHHFRGGDASHGAKGWRRRSGAIGQRLFPGTVQRGKRMPGHMGCVRRTVQNLQVIQVREAQNLLLIKGAIPGPNGGYVIVRQSKKLRDKIAQTQKVEGKPAKGGAKAAAAKPAASPAKK